MIILSSEWSIETFPIQERMCPCCKEASKFVTGMVYDENDDDLAMYGATLAEHVGDRQVALHLGLFVRDKEGKELKKDFVSLLLWNHEGEIVTSVVTDPHDPIGRVMTREEALASPFKSLIFEIDDFIVKNDPHIGPFLEGGGETPSQEGK
jgi:hypothetical protein